MNVTEEEFRIQGALVEDMMPVFEEFKLIVNLYNYIGPTFFFHLTPKGKIKIY